MKTIIKHKVHVKKGDQVIVTTGDEKGKTGKVIEVFPLTNRVVVEGVAMSKKSQKPKAAGQRGQIIDKQHSIQASNVRLAERATKSKKK